MKRSVLTNHAPAVLLGVAVLVSMGASADASTAAAITLARQGAFVGGSDSERRAVAQLLVCLTDAARKLQGQPAAIDRPNPRESWAAAAAERPTFLHQDARAHESRLIPPRQTDLPPPAL